MPRETQNHKSLRPYVMQVNWALEITEQLETVVDAARLAAEHAPGIAVGRSRTVDLRRLAEAIDKLDSIVDRHSATQRQMQAQTCD